LSLSSRIKASSVLILLTVYVRLYQQRFLPTTCRHILLKPVGSVLTFCYLDKKSPDRWNISKTKHFWEKCFIQNYKS